MGDRWWKLEWRHETPVFHKEVDGTKVYRDLSKKSIIEDLDHSLLTLGTDYIDVLYTHWQTTDKKLYPIEETMDALMTLKKTGQDQSYWCVKCYRRRYQGILSIWTA